jgi:hypothetical protein
MIRGIILDIRIYCEAIPRHKLAAVAVAVGMKTTKPHEQLTSCQIPIEYKHNLSFVASEYVESDLA